MKNQQEIKSWLHNNVPMMGEEMFNEAVLSLQNFITAACQQSQCNKIEGDNFETWLSRTAHYSRTQGRWIHGTGMGDIDSLFDYYQGLPTTAPVPLKDLEDLTRENYIEVARISKYYALNDDEEEWLGRCIIGWYLKNKDPFKGFNEYNKPVLENHVMIMTARTLSKIIDYLRNNGYKITL